MIGREIRSRAFDPAAAFWRSQGIRPKPARALSRGGIASPDDLRKLTREELLSLPGIGVVTLHQLEELLESRIPSRADYWVSRGLVLPIAEALVREGIYSLDDLGRLTLEQFLSFRGLGDYALAQCERLLGWRLPASAACTEQNSSIADSDT